MAKYKLQAMPNLNGEDAPFGLQYKGSGSHEIWVKKSKKK